jgi:glycosyltransferase 2 family protein
VTDASSAVAPPREPSLLVRMLPKLAVSIALGALFAWLASRGGVPLLPAASAFAAVEPWTIPVYVLSLCVLHWLRASRWRFLIAPIKRVPLRDVILLNWIGFFAIFALPLRLGELARPTLTKLRHGIPISVGFGTVAVERVVDGLLTSLCVAWALFVLPRLGTLDPVARHLPTYGYAALLLFSCAFVALGMFLWQRALAVRLTQWGAGLVSARLGELLAEKVGNVADGLRSIGSAKLAAGFLLESIAYWGVNAVGVWLLGVGCGLPLSLGHAVAIMGVLAIGILLPTGPGLFGNFQLAVFACLRLFFPESLVATQGAVFVFLLYALQSAVMLVAGVIPLYALRLRMADLVHVPPDSVRPPEAAENLAR